MHAGSLDIFSGVCHSALWYFKESVSLCLENAQCTHDHAEEDDADQQDVGIDLLLNEIVDAQRKYERKHLRDDGIQHILDDQIRTTGGEG